MENQNKDLRIEYVGEHPSYGKVACIIFIRDGIAVHKFSDARYAKFMYLQEKEVNPHIIYNERLHSYAEKFDGEKKEEIAKHFIKKLEEHNIKFKEK